MSVKQKIIIALIALLVITTLTYLYIFSPDVQLLKATQPTKTVEAKIISIIGRKNGKKFFEINADAIKSDKDQSDIEVYNLKKCKIYDEKSEPVLKDLYAEHALIRQYEGYIKITGDQDKPVTALIKLENIQKGEFSKLKAKTIVIRNNIKKAYIENAIITNKKLTLYSDNIEIDANQKLAKCYPYPKIKTPFLEAKATTFEINYSQNTLMGTNEVDIFLKNNGAKIKSDYMLFYIDKDRLELKENVKISQKGKFSTAEKLEYDNSTGQIVLRNNVKTIIEKGSAFLREDTIKKIRNAETKKILQSGIFVSCDNFYMNSVNGDATAEGSVLILQKNNRAKSDNAFFAENSETLTLNGNVYVEKNKQWLKTQKIIASLSKEEFEAVGNVQSEIKIKRKR